MMGKRILAGLNESQRSLRIYLTEDEKHFEINENAHTDLIPVSEFDTLIDRIGVNTLGYLDYTKTFMSNFCGRMVAKDIFAIFDKGLYSVITIKPFLEIEEMVLNCINNFKELNKHYSIYFNHTLHPTIIDIKKLQNNKNIIVAPVSIRVFVEPNESLSIHCNILEKEDGELHVIGRVTLIFDKKFMKKDYPMIYEYLFNLKASEFNSHSEHELKTYYIEIFNTNNLYMLNKSCPLYKTEFINGDVIHVLP